MTLPVPLLEARNLVVERGGFRVLDLPYFSLARNETVAIIGPNGSGKSSLLLSLANLLPITSGELFFKGEPLDFNADGTSYRRQLAMVFQEPLLFDTTVADNVATGLKIRGFDRHGIRKRVAEALERFRITDLAGRSARKLSGGEAQRTSLARAFATEPELLLLDEPFTSLDPLTRKALIEDLQKSLHRSNITTVITSHEREDVSRLADRIVVLEGGCMLQSGNLAEVRANPINPYTAAFFGD